MAASAVIALPICHAMPGEERKALARRIHAIMQEAWTKERCAARYCSMACVGVVTAAGTVTVSVRNASASTATLTPGTWQVLVIKP